VVNIKYSKVHLEKVKELGGKNLLHGPIIGDKNRQNKFMTPG
jgi:hypothetical protein